MDSLNNQRQKRINVLQDLIKDGIHFGGNLVQEDDVSVSHHVPNKLIDILKSLYRSFLFTPIALEAGLSHL